ncbi:hypothetical protein [Phenylobacterium immobile]|uniref:hypothetical protein n=1 Tax=Phenylobacterium immobile TaxID=21 RepID=UPI000B857792|nr:hypothetical protein [Phenylobacterium immobile]
MTTACAPKPGETASASQAADAQAEAGKAYVRSPAVSAVRLEAGRLVLSGRAAPNAAVRLAAPGGGEAFAQADGEGAWSLQLPALATPAIYGVSAESGGRRLQGEGYILLTPQGEAALLRSGAGAVRLDRQEPGRIGAIDYDAGGQAVVSGTAPAGLTVSLYLDRKRVAEGRVDAAGRYSIAVPQALAAGAHRLEASGVRFAAVAAFERTLAPGLTAGPLRTSPTATGLRADWLTPGGGVQTTVLVRESLPK